MLEIPEAWKGIYRDAAPCFKGRQQKEVIVELKIIYHFITWRKCGMGWKEELYLLLKMLDSMW